MDVMVLRIFQRQVRDQCQLVLASGIGINQALATGDQDSLWINCQTFLVGAANLSKALWGDGRSRTKVAPRRLPLRQSLNIDDTSPLFDVAMRNNFEHYDQRIDQWWSQSKSHNHVDRVIGPPNTVGGVDNIDRFRVFDTSTGSIEFWGDAFALQPIVAEVERVFAIAEIEAEKPHW